MKETKICEYCGKTFNRLPDLSNRQWAERRFCSRKCVSLSLQKRKLIICAHCGKGFQVYQSSSQKFCSTSCANKGKSRSRPTWLSSPENKMSALISRKEYFQARQQYRNCEYCNNPFPVGPKSKRRFCSRHCKDRWWSEHRLETMFCLYCGKPFQRSTKSARRSKKKFCSRRCYLEFCRKRPPEQHHSWKGGECYYGPDWDEIAERVRQRDKVCQDCGKVPDDNGGSLDVHHIIPIRDFNGDYKSANVLSNLKALCKSCHRKYQEREY